MIKFSTKIHQQPNNEIKLETSTFEHMLTSFGFIRIVIHFIGVTLRNINQQKWIFEICGIENFRFLKVTNNLVLKQR